MTSPKSEWRLRIATMAGSELEEVAEKLRSTVENLRCNVDLIVEDLERGFDPGRGERNGDTVTLMFNDRGIDAMFWLVNRALETVEDLERRANGLAEGVEVAA